MSDENTEQTSPPPAEELSEVESLKKQLEEANNTINQLKNELEQVQSLFNTVSKNILFDCIR